MSSAGYLSHIAGIIPFSIVAPFIDHQVMSALLLSIAVGVAIRHISDDESRTAVLSLFKGLHNLFVVVTGWIIKIIPMAIFGFITSTIAQLQSGINTKGLGAYLSVVVLANLVQGFVVLPLLLYVHKINPINSFRGMLSALSIAFFSKSSIGTLPVTMAAVEKLGVSQETSRTVLPMCTSINMNGCAAFIFTTVVYLVQNNGATIGLQGGILWILIATIAAVGNAGVPMGCFFLSASLLTSMNVPITLLGLILPFYGIIDMVETTLNVF